MHPWPFFGNLTHLMKARPIWIGAADFLLTTCGRLCRGLNLHIVRRSFENAIESRITERKRVFRQSIFRGRCKCRVNAVAKNVDFPEGNADLSVRIYTSDFAFFYFIFSRRLGT